MLTWINSFTQSSSWVGWDACLRWAKKVAGARSRSPAALQSNSFFLSQRNRSSRPCLTRFLRLIVPLIDPCALILLQNATLFVACSRKVAWICLDITKIVPIRSFKSETEIAFSKFTSICSFWASVQCTGTNQGSLAWPGLGMTKAGSTEAHLRATPVALRLNIRQN